MISIDRILPNKQIYNFLRSVTIKFEPFAQSINNALIQKGYSVNDQDPESWKYYLNLQGRYHPADEKMYVTSLDTREQILLTPEILVNHPRTRSVYVPGGMYYERLCATYPEQVDLIKSILFPVPAAAKAITAGDLTLLAYGSGYLEEYEEDVLIGEVRSFLETLKERWYFDFLDDEPYFHVTFWSGLWNYLAMLLMSLRESYILTPYAHTSHVWSALKSEGLDDYSDILDRKKAMMLYQNIEFFKANAGKQSNLMTLGDRLLSDFGVSIYGRKVIQESESNAQSYQLVPQLQAIPIPMNKSTVITEIASVPVSVIQSQAFSKGLTIENNAEAHSRTERRMGDTVLNSFMTKFLEIRPTARNNVYSDIINMFLLETLTTAILYDYYDQPVVAFDNNLGGSLYLYPRELLALYHYATQKSLGLNPINIPNEFVLNRAFLPVIGTPAKKIKREDETVYISMHVDAGAYLSDLHYTQGLRDPADFSQMLDRLWMRYLSHMVEDQETKDDTKHYILRYLTSMCHEHRVENHQLVQGFTDYATWLGRDGLDIQSSFLAPYDIDLDPTQAWGNLADSIISALVPITDTLSHYGNFTLSDFGYERLRELFVQMCSYRVVFLETSRETPQFGAGAKWSNRNGPDHIEVFGDHNLIRKVMTKDTPKMQGDMILHTGMTEHRKTSAREVVPYNVTLVSDTESITAVQPAVRSYGVQTGSTRVICGGPMLMPHASMDVTMPVEVPTTAYLIDGDGRRLKDSDDGLIIDPDT